MGHSKEMMRREGSLPLDIGERYQATRINTSPTAKSHASLALCQTSRVTSVITLTFQRAFWIEIIKLTAGHCSCDQKYISHSRAAACTRCFFRSTYNCPQRARTTLRWVWVRNGVSLLIIMCLTQWIFVIKGYFSLNSLSWTLFFVTRFNIWRFTLTWQGALSSVRMLEDNERVPQRMFQPSVYSLSKRRWLTASYQCKCEVYYHSCPSCLTGEDVPAFRWCFS